jgi:diketogulonate reductase-like aldo/keto reductase
MKKIQLSNTGEKIPIIGQGIWGIENGRNQEYYEQWKTSLRKGIELEMTHIDTSASYRDDKVEKILGEVLTEYGRDDLFITGKLSSWNFRFNNMKKSVYESLKRIGIDSYDLYLIPGSNIFASKKKYLRILEDLVNEGKIRYLGVSNFSVKQFKKAQHLLKRGELVNNQLKVRNDYPHHIFNSLVYYAKKGITLTVYNPLRDFNKTSLNWYYQKKFNKVGVNQKITVQQMSIAWLIKHMNIITLLNPFHIKYLGEVAKLIDVRLDRGKFFAVNKAEDETNNFRLIQDKNEVDNFQWI